MAIRVGVDVGRTSTDVQFFVRGRGSRGGLLRARVRVHRSEGARGEAAARFPVALRTEHPSGWSPKE
jgi:hypothetical protein